jgi:hypothetical protein
MFVNERTSEQEIQRKNKVREDCIKAKKETE